MHARLISYSQPVGRIHTGELAHQGLDNIQDLIAYAARVSNPSNQANTKTTAKLLDYLIKHKHWSPFEMASACIEVTTTRDIARQFLRHRSFSFQEFSQRYANINDLSNNFVLREALGATCSHGPTCGMYRGTNIQTWISLSITAIIILIGLIIMFTKLKLSQTRRNSVCFNKIQSAKVHPLDNKNNKNNKNNNHPTYSKYTTEGANNSSLNQTYAFLSIEDKDVQLSFETVNNFVRDKIRNLDGALSVIFYPVVKAKRFAPLADLIKVQQKHLADKAKKIPKSELDEAFDFVEDFEEYALLTGAFPRDLE